jgi:hypothetical protein
MSAAGGVPPADDEIAAKSRQSARARGQPRGRTENIRGSRGR